MPNHRSIVALALLSWLGSVALAAASWPGDGLDPDRVRSHMTLALAALLMGLLSHSWMLLYAFGVSAESRRRADLGAAEQGSDDLRAVRTGAARTQVAAAWALMGLICLAGLGMAAQVAAVRPQVHGLGSALVLLVQVACLVAEARNLERLRHSLLRLEAREVAS